MSERRPAGSAADSPVDDEESRAAMRAFLQRSEVRLSTVHRVGQALLGGSALVLLLPLFIRDGFPRMTTLLMSSWRPVTSRPRTPRSRQRPRKPPGAVPGARGRGPRRRPESEPVGIPAGHAVLASVCRRRRPRRPNAQRHELLRRHDHLPRHRARGRSVRSDRREGTDGAAQHARAARSIDGPRPPRTLAQRRADALMRLVAGDRAAQIAIDIIVDVDTFAGRPPTDPTRGCCEIVGTGPMSPELVRTLACDCAIGRVLMRGASEVLDLGRRTRLITPALRRTLARDRTCVEPGCDIPAQWCDGHHILRGSTTAPPRSTTSSCDVARTTSPTATPPGPTTPAVSPPPPTPAPVPGVRSEATGAAERAAARRLLRRLGVSSKRPERCPDRRLAASEAINWAGPRGRRGGSPRAAPPRGGHPSGARRRARRVAAA